MEGREGMSSGGEGPSTYDVVPRTENPNQANGSETEVCVGLAETTEKKKRGRPRKYEVDGGVTMALSPTPTSISSSGKRGKGRSHSDYKRYNKTLGGGGSKYFLILFLF